MIIKINKENFRIKTKNTINMIPLIEISKMTIDLEKNNMIQRDKKKRIIINKNITINKNIKVNILLMIIRIRDFLQIFNLNTITNHNIIPTFNKTNKLIINKRYMPINKTLQNNISKNKI